MQHQKTYQAKQVGPHAFEPKGPRAPQWYHFDAEGQVVGRAATLLARVLSGKHKPTYTKHSDAGDFVVVTNADKVVFTRRKWDQKTYYRHTGWSGGLKEITAKDLLKRKPEEVLKKAVWGMLNHSALGRRQLKKLKIYASNEHPHSAQNPLPMPKSVMRVASATQKASAGAPAKAAEKPAAKPEQKAGE